MPDAIPIERLIDALRDPGAYSHAPAKVTMLQTHASLLFFAGDRVYKVKKPVDYGFLDFSTFERRRHFCEEEVRLNRRLAPKVYLGVAPIVQRGDGRLCIGGEGVTIEHAVEMLRLPGDRMLDRLLERDAATAEQLDAIADRIAAFHASARSDEAVRAFGEPDRVRQRIETNLAECEPLAGDLPSEAGGGAPVVSRATLARIGAWSEHELGRRRSLISSRARSGFVREGHGDLHAGNICVTEDGGVVAYDCIEFEPSFRCLDVAAEIAFLAMDLERRGHVAAAARLVNRYAEAAGDRDLHALQALHRCHYACVRGKVAALRARGAGERSEEAWREAVAYFHLALGYTLPASLVVMSGLPGTGKSWWGRQIGTALRAEVVRSDVVRKARLGMTPTQRPSDAAARNQLYSIEITEITYQTIEEGARESLESGRSVVLDATAPTRALRTRLLGAGGAHAPRLIALCECPEAVVVERLRRRSAAGDDPSDADVRVYLEARAGFETLAPGEPNVRLECREHPWVGIERVLKHLADASAIPETR